VPTAPGDLPKVSVIVRTKDRPDLLAEALASLRAQTFTDFETLVVNDGGSLPGEALEPAPGRALRIVRPEPPGGRARALNAGLAAAGGTFVAYLDDDDLYLPSHLETLVAALEKEGAPEAAFSGVDQIARRRGPDGNWRDEELLFRFGSPFDADRILFRNDVPLISLLHRRDLVGRIGPFDPAFDLFEDWDFLIRLSRAAALLYVPETTAVYRVRDDDTNATRANPWQGPAAEAMRRRLFEKHAALRTPEATMAAVDGFDGAVWLRDGEIRELRERVVALERAVAEAGARLGESAARFTRLEALFKEERAADARRLEEAKLREAALASERDALGEELRRVHDSLWWRLGGPWWRLRRFLSR
jgi:glycosyltransferase involved in cell wall biosynthesis